MNNHLLQKCGWCSSLELSSQKGISDIFEGRLVPVLFYLKEELTGLIFVCIFRDQLTPPYYGYMKINLTVDSKETDNSSRHMDGKRNKMKYIAYIAESAWGFPGVESDNVRFPVENKQILINFISLLLTN